MIRTAEQGGPVPWSARARVASTTSAVTWCATPKSVSSTGAIHSGSTPALQKGGSPSVPGPLPSERLGTLRQLLGCHAARQPAARHSGMHVYMFTCKPSGLGRLGFRQLQTSNKQNACL